MMAEEAQDDLSMEDILSSIKDILDKDATEQTEDEVSPHQETVALQPQNDVSVEEVEADDDVYDLSAAMIINETATSSADNDIDLKLDEVDVNIDDVTADLSVEDITIPEIMAEPVVDAEFSVEEQSVDFNLADEAEPIFSPEDNAIESDEPEETLDVGALLEKPVQETEENVVLDAEVEDVAENIDDILTSASKVIYADNRAEEKEETAETDSADVSANIISNFAKMFAEKAPAEPVVEAKAEKTISAEPIKLLGNGARTIEQVVEDVIKNIIGETVSAELSKNVDINTFAEQEIKTQTKAWLDAKLPSIVEAAVQKEIERVMAKVGR